MHRKDLDTYRHLAALGDPIVGFDARDYVTHLGDGHANDHARAAGGRLHADHRARAPGAGRRRASRRSCWSGSRAAPGSRSSPPGGCASSIAGVVAVALTQEEEYVRWYRHLPLRMRRAGSDGGRLRISRASLAICRSPSFNRRTTSTCRRRRLASSLARTRRTRWLQPIDAANHNFGGARERDVRRHPVGVELGHESACGRMSIESARGRGPHSA